MPVLVGWVIYSDLQEILLITLGVLKNNNMNNYIVTFQHRVMVTTFAILAMF